MHLPKTLDITYIQRNYGQKPTDFEKLIKSLCTVTHLDELVYIFHHIPLFTEISLITDINIFKTGIKPLWEHADNITGGKYIIKLKRCVGQRLFERLVIAFAICDDNINGIVASIRSSQVILSVWCNTTQNNLDFVKRVRKMLDVDYDIPIEYKDNDESIKDNSSFRNTAVFGKHNVDITINELEKKVEVMDIEKKGKKMMSVLIDEFGIHPKDKKEVEEESRIEKIKAPMNNKKKDYYSNGKNTGNKIIGKINNDANNEIFGLGEDKNLAEKRCNHTLIHEGDADKKNNDGGKVKDTIRQKQWNKAVSMVNTNDSEGLYRQKNKDKK